MAQGDESQKQGWSINPVSPLERDDEMHVPFNMLSMDFPKRPSLGTPGNRTFFNQVNFDLRTKALPATWGGSVLLWIAGGRSEKILIFAHELLPSKDLELKPSDFKWIKRVEQWPALIRNNPAPTFTPDISRGNYFGMDIILDDIPAMSLDTDVLVEEWWTTEPWPREMMLNVSMTPGWVRWNYPLGFSGRKRALHDDITVPALNGVKALNGQAVAWQTGHRPQRDYPATQPKTWVNKIRNNQTRVSGHWHRRRETSYVPCDPQTNPPTMIQIGT